MTYDRAVALIRCSLILAFILISAEFSWAETPPQADSAAPIPAAPATTQMITMDFNNVDLPIFVKFVSEITGKNFVIDERVRGKVTVFSPTKISIEKAYQVLLSVLELRGLTAVSQEGVIKIIPLNEMPLPERTINVYYLENANAEEMVKVLSGIIAKSGAPTPPRPVSQPQPGPGGPVSLPSGPMAAAGEFEGLVLIAADKATNALIITASSKDYEKLRDVIKKLDIKRKQVYVEAVIMEISMDHLRQIGAEIQAPLPTTLDAAGNSVLSNTLSPIGGTNFGGLTTFASQGPVGLTGLAIGVVKGTFTFGGNTFLNVGGLLRALESDNDVNLLSAPQLLTSDNQKAEIIVAQNVPFPTGQSQTVGGNILTTIDRKDVGIILRLTPQILDNNTVKLDVYQEISALTNTPQSISGVVVGPTTNKRSATSIVVVKDKQTVVLGGLVQDNLTVSVNKVPFLGDIPVLGWLFKFHSREPVKTNLLIFLTPYIVKEPEDLTAIRSQKTEQMSRFLEKEKIENRGERKEFLETINPPKPEPQAEPKQSPGP
ncbi:MAG TPA: type II secretion system secretin GspD [Nitrospiria bacterium]|jgi:general secretion pathway protein D|nr:type II secretion system secretin GspD [Nitrospiria bacterium]